MKLSGRRLNVAGAHSTAYRRAGAIAIAALMGDRLNDALRCTFVVCGVDITL